MNTKRNKIFLGTVCLDRNRWSTRQPSFDVSEWIERFSQDGFDGIELWSYHYLHANEQEQDRLAETATPVAVFNSYVGFDDEHQTAREAETNAIVRLQAKAVKFNVGNNLDAAPIYKKNLQAWAKTLPEECKFLCECHPGTILENLPVAMDFFADLDPVKFGIVVHVGNLKQQSANAWFDAFQSRVQHLHIQLRALEQDPADPANRPALDAAFESVAHGQFSGTITMEFTRGIGREEQIEQLYQNVITDMHYVRGQLT